MIAPGTTLQCCEDVLLIKICKQGQKKRDILADGLSKILRDGQFSAKKKKKDNVFNFYLLSSLIWGETFSLGM